jgi:hypothetical protein
VPELAGKIAAVFVLGGRYQADHIDIVIAQPLDIGRFEDGVTYPARFDHCFLHTEYFQEKWSPVFRRKCDPKEALVIIAHRARSERKTAMHLRGHCALARI